MGSEDQSRKVHSKKIKRDYHHPKEDTLQEIVPRIRTALTRIKQTREHIMLMIHRMMNLPQRESDKRVMTLQMRMNMY